MRVLSLLTAFSAATSTTATLLTPKNWDAETAGKTVFLKFLAPWWGHCKSMKPAWDKLIDNFKDSPTSLVADIDCTAEGEPLCTKHGVRGYPTIKWGAPDDLQDYQGGRDFESLKKFADENLGPQCGPANLDLCDSGMKAKYEKLLGMSVERLDQKIVQAERLYAEIPMVKKVKAQLKKAAKEEL